MSDLSQNALAALALGATVVAVLALLIAITCALRVRRIRDQYRVLWGEGTVDVASLATRQQATVCALGTQVEGLREQVADLRSDVGQGLRHVAVVRYDAFGDMGGRLSFSAAVVDDAGDGLVISSIHGRGESRTYAKGIVAGGGHATLTPEEQQALAEARPGGRHSQPAGRRGGRAGGPKGPRVAHD